MVRLGSWSVCFGGLFGPMVVLAVALGFVVGGRSGGGDPKGAAEEAMTRQLRDRRGHNAGRACVRRHSQAACRGSSVDRQKMIARVVLLDK